MTADDLRSFTAEVRRAFEEGRIRAPVHLCGGNEEQLIGVFQKIDSRRDFVFATYRAYYHALLHGVPRERVLEQILAGRCMNLSFPEHRFYTSAIVAGACPAAVGVAEALRRWGEPGRVWCFVGDMAANAGLCMEAVNYAAGHCLPFTLVVEDNGLSTNTPTAEVWGSNPPSVVGYTYERTVPHTGVGKWVTF